MNIHQKKLLHFQGFGLRKYIRLLK
ncbi:hypothetical protein CIB84_005815 [Bambusicola thoracicus]|uniref:Uncharacterized protein n=1 Tax=Bambusicola thoracicus TaxID=9083 RepID=A0A2P4T276_BAMTH|nr:hypothetical protein CIB84_005815 [Bambusicola thoracicus]